MKKILVFALLVAFGAISEIFAQDRDLNFKNIEDCFIEFRTAVGGYYGTRVLKNSVNLNMATIEQYMREWKANRCLWRAIAVAEPDDVEYNPISNDYRLIVQLPKGRAFFIFKTNKQGFFRFAEYQKEGNVNSCPAGVLKNNCTLYADVDIVGQWSIKDIAWVTYPPSVKDKLYDENFVKSSLENRLKSLNWEYLKTIGVVVFNAGGSGKFVTTNGENPFQWRLSYNQLQIKYPNGDWFPLSFRIDKNGYFNLIDRKDPEGDVGFIYSRQ